MTDAFSSLHPAVLFLFFLIVLSFSMSLTHPVFLLISAASACIYYMSCGGNGKKTGLRYIIPLALTAVIVNPLFNHEGETILAYLPDSNPLTLEAVCYGGAAGIMLCAVIVWFSCFSVLMTSDKLIFLFGRIIPALSLVFSMILRFIPRYIAQLRLISNAQRLLGGDAGQGMRARARSGLKVLSIITTWALESSAETADSMKSRGYGLSGRTAFSNYRMTGRDKIIFAYFLLSGLTLTTGVVLGGMKFDYFPTFNANEPDICFLCLCVCYTLFCLSPVVINFLEERKWQALRSEA